MTRDEMLKTLQSLHQELTAADNVDDETKNALQALTGDIERVLANENSDSESDDQKTLSERLRESVIEFEVRHPVIGGLLERLTDGLANLGI